MNSAANLVYRFGSAPPPPTQTHTHNIHTHTLTHTHTHTHRHVLKYYKPANADHLV